jgi:pyrroline-5-carboxylate reductase
MKIGIIGCGTMGSLLAKGLKEHSLFLFDRNPKKVKSIAKETKGHICGNLKEVAENSNLIILAIKPQNLSEITDLLNKELKKNQILISLLAGIPLETLKMNFPLVTSVRLMPNLAIRCGEGIIGLCDNNLLNTKTRKSLTTLFQSFGKIYWIAEKKMEGFTALTASGPAFLFAILEAMIDAGIAMGLPAKEAQELSYQMVKGSISLLEKTHKHPAEHKWEVTSPAGTTIAGIRHFEKKGVRGAIIETFLATYERAQNFKK